MRLSNVYDEIQKTFSYKELVFCSTQHLYYLYKENTKSTKNDFIKDLLDLFKDL